MTTDTTPLPDTAPLFPSGVIVRIAPEGSNLYGHYIGPAGARWNGRKHRVRLLDGQNRYLEAENVERVLFWKPVGGHLCQWEKAQLPMEELL